MKSEAYFSKSSYSWISIATLMYTTWASRDLILGWINAPYEKLSLLIFILWLTPIVVYWYIKRKILLSSQSSLLFLAIACTAIGIAGSMNFMKYIGLALSLAALIPGNIIQFVWIASAFSWMPALGWLGSHYFSPQLFWVRLLIVLIGITSEIYKVRTLLTYKD